MKRWMAALAASALILALTAGCSQAGPPAASEPHTVTVNGKGEIEATPDIAVLRIGVVSNGRTSEAAREKNAAAISATTEAVGAIGVAEEDVKTSGLSLWPTYNDGGNSITGYTMRMTLEITVRDVTKAGEVIDAAIASGSNTLDNVSFELGNKDELYQKALAAAVENARRSAEGLAAAGGKKVGPVVSITETSSGVASPSGNFATAGENAAVDAGTKLMTGAATVSARVEVIYELE